MMISALFVEKNGVYYNMPNVDPWDIERDARLYNYDNPVICHPPCQLWGKFAKVNYKRWGGDHNKPGNDQGCFESALNNLNRCGGVLEHPAFSYAWEKFSLPKPEKLGWKYENGFYVCEVWQSAYGHKATKRTWLLYKGNKPPFELNWAKKKGFYQIGGCDQRGPQKNKTTLRHKHASATPLKFRNTLILLAQNTRCHNGICF